jgi:hypothetical protein
MNWLVSKFHYLSFVLLAKAESEPYYPLPPLNVNPDLITVAGFSSGGKNSHNLHLVMSDTFKGAGLLNDGLYSIPFKDRIIEIGKTAEQIV